MRVLLVLGVAACGRVGFDASPDATSDAPKFDTPFGTPVVQSSLGSAVSDDDPTMTDDLLEVFLSSGRLGGEKVFRATRATSTDPWGPVVHVAELDVMGAFINHPSIAPDGLALYYGSSRPPSLGGTDLWVATRPDRASPFDPPQHLPGLSSPQADGDPVIGDTWIYFSSTRGGGTDHYMARRASPADPFGAPERVPSLSSASFDSGVWVDVTETLSCFASQFGQVRDDLYCATREGIDQPFGPWIPVAELNSTEIDQDPWLSSDLRTIVFSSERSGDAEIYIATR